MLKVLKNVKIHTYTCDIIELERSSVNITIFSCSISHIKCMLRSIFNLYFIEYINIIAISKKLHYFPTLIYFFAFSYFSNFVEFLKYFLSRH